MKNMRSLLVCVWVIVGFLPAWGMQNPSNTSNKVESLRYILTALRESDGYKVEATCIDTDGEDELSGLKGIIKYNWGVKYPGKDIRWTETDVPVLQVQITTDTEPVLVFLELVDNAGNKGPVQFVELNSPEIYYAINQRLYVDAQGHLYKESKSKYSYNSGRLYLYYKDDLDEEYKERKWMITSAMVFSPYSRTQKIAVQNGGPLIRDILPESELEEIRKSSEEGRVYTYTLMLLNAAGKAVQFVPVSFTFKTTI